MSDTKPYWDFQYSPDVSATFASASFAEGASRRAYRAMRWTPPEKWGQKAVVKEYKDRYSWAQGDWDTAVSTYKKAKDLADRFNIESRTNFPIQMVDYYIGRVSKSNEGTPKLNEWVMVEDFLEGDFQKYISNSGWVKPRCFSEYPSMPAFAHWSWVHTGGSLMVSDLQGVRYDSKYVLTDPAILSLEGSYGSTDLSLVGMGLFFLSHQCTDVCRSLGIVHKRPDMSQIQWFMNSEFGGLVQMATTYFPKEKFESLPPQTKQVIRDVLMKTFRPHYLY